MNSTKNRNRNRNMKYGKIKLLIICVWLLYTGLMGCKTTRDSLRLTIGKNEESVREGLRKNKVDFKTIWIKKYNCEIRENWKRKEFYGDIKIIKGERIIITIKSGIGIETARILLTKDSVKIVDRMKKEVFCGGYKQMKRYFGLIDCYKKAENLLVGSNSMVIDEMENKAGDKYNIKQGENKNEIIIYDRVIKMREKRFTVEIENNSIIEYMEKNEEIEMLKVGYLSWNDVGNIKFPKELKIEINYGRGKNIAIIKYEKVEIDRQISNKFKIPDGYTVINL